MAIYTLDWTQVLVRSSAVKSVDKLASVKAVKSNARYSRGLQLGEAVWAQKRTKSWRPFVLILRFVQETGLILGLRPANERRRYFVTTSLIGWVQAHN